MKTANFRKPELSDKEWIEGAFYAYPQKTCDRNFANVYLWARFYDLEVADFKKCVVFREFDDGVPGYAFPAGPDDAVREVIRDMVTWFEEAGHPFYIYSVTESQFAKLDTWYPGEFTIEYERDFSDYIYETEKLATLSGKKLHSKRNHINKFNIVYEGRWQYETITDANLEDCFQMAMKWRNLNGCEEDEEKNDEMCVSLNALRLYKELDLTGGCLRVDGEIVAFTLGEKQDEETFVVHIEKALTDVEGAYTVINQQFVEHELLGKYKYVNREDDAGEEGLRKAKLSYKPVMMVDKGVVRRKCDKEEKNNDL